MAANDKQYKEAMKNLDNLVRKQEALKKSTDSLNKSWDAISTQVFQIGGAEWFKKVPLAAEDVSKINDEMKKITEQVKVLEKGFDDALDSDEKYKLLQSNSQTYFAEYQENLKNLKATNLSDTQAEIEAKEMMFDSFKGHYSELSELSNEEIENIIASTKEGYKLSEVYEDLSEASKMLLIASGDNSEEMMNFKNQAEKAITPLKGMVAQLEDGTKSVFSLSSAWEGFSSNLIKKAVAGLLEFDTILNSVQKNTGINMDENAQAFGDLTTRVAQFGMGIEGAGEMMMDLSDELDTTNFSVLSKATEDFAAIEGATGAVSKDITAISGQMMRMGKSSEEVKDYFEDADQMARKFGVSSKKAIEGISRNITKMRSMGFVGGEKSLMKMSIQAQKLNQNVDEIFNVAKKARTIEGAMEMASELQLAGGSFANINPMDLLAAARGGPEELQKILNGMGKDIGRFNKEIGEYEFDPVDVDRLQMVSDATGQSLDDIMNGIQKSGMDQQKLEPFAGMLDGLDEADKALMGSSISDMMKWDADKGAFVLDAESGMAKRMGIDSLEELQSMSAADLKKKMEEDAKTLEEQNKRNQAFTETMKNLWNALISIFTIFQPVVEILTSVMQNVAATFAMLPGWSKYLIAGLLLFSTSFGASVLTFIGKGLSGIKNVLTGKSGIIGKMRVIPEKVDKTPTDLVTTPKTPEAGPKPGAGEGFKSLADGLGAMGTTSGVFKGILAVALAGPALLLFVPALPGLLVMALIGTMGKFVTAGFSAVAQGIGAFGADPGVFKGIGAIALAAPALLLFSLALPGLLVMALIGAMGELIVDGFSAIAEGLGLMGEDLTGIAKGALALLIIGVALAPFVYAAVMMSDVDWLNVLAGVGVMILVVAALVGLGFLAIFAGGLIIAGAAILAVAGVAMMIASEGLMAMGEAFAMLGDIDASNIIALSLAMFMLGPGLLAFAFAVFFLGFISFEPLKQLGESLATIGAIDPGNLAALGQALNVLSPGLMMFGLASLFFLNPFILLGLVFMIWALDALVKVMEPLANALSLGSESLNSFAEGLHSLSAAADSLSDEKLEKLQKISEAMAAASASGNIASVIAAVSSGGEGGGGGGTRKLEIDIKMNGRDVAHRITKDSQIVK